LVNVTPPAKGDVASVTWDIPLGEPLSLDPVKVWDPASQTVLPNICEALLRVEPNLQVGPSLATSIRAESASRYVFTIRQGVKFWDGHPMTMADVLYSLRSQLSPSSFYAVFTSLIKSITQTGPWQITVTTKVPFVYYQKLMAMGLGTIYEKAYAQRAGAAYGTPSGGVMCTGPFKLKSWQPGQQITLVRNPLYWDKPHAAKASTFIFKFITNPATVVDGLASGELDGSYELPPRSIPVLQASGAGHVYFGPSLIMNVLQAVATKGPVANPLIRQAIALAIDRQGLANATFNGYAAPARWPFPPWYGYAQSTFRAAYNSLPNDSRPNLTAARALVKRAGTPTSAISLAALSGSDASVGIATEAASAMTAIGLNAKVDVLQPAAYTNIYFSAKARQGIGFVVGTGGGTFEDFPDPVEILFLEGETTSPYNLDHYSNPQLDSLVTRAMATLNPATRATLVTKAALAYTHGEAMIPLVSAPESVFLNNRITGAPTPYSVWNLYPWAAAIGSTS